MSRRISYFGTLPPFQGGIAQHAAQVIARLRLAGYEVTTTSWASQYPAFLYRGDQPSAAEKRDAEPTTAFVAHWWNPIDWWRAGRAARTGLGLIQPWVTPFHALAVIVSARAARPAPTVLLVHNIETHEWFPLRVLLTKAALRSVTSAIVHSTTVANQVKELVPTVPIDHVPMPRLIDVGASPLPEGPIRLLMIGYVRPYKGVQVALDALRLLKDAEFPTELLIMGEFWQPTLPEVEAMVAQRGLDKIVHLRAGYVADDVIVKELADHHVVLLPYLTATQSAIAPLAIAANRPMIASNLPGLAEQITDGMDGLLFEPGSAVSLAEAIREAANRLDSLYRGAAARSEVAAEEEILTLLERHFAEGLSKREG